MTDTMVRNVSADVTEAYIDFLGRAPDAAGRTFWENQINNGMSIDQMRQMMAGSPEAKRTAEKEIARFYQQYLGRVPDAGGMAFWMNQFITGSYTLGEIQENFAVSPEAKKYAETLPQGTITDNGVIGLPADHAEQDARARAGLPPLDPSGGLPTWGQPDQPGGGDAGGVDGSGAGVDDASQIEDALAAAEAAQVARDEENRARSARNAEAELKAAFPFVVDLGLGSNITEWAREGFGADAIIGFIRQTDAWKTMFPNIRRADGTLLMNEGRYLEQMDSYREVLRGFGKYDQRYDSNAELSGFMAEGIEIDPTELEERLGIYSAIERNDDVRNAFYIYAGMRVSTDDLYQAVVDPRHRQNLSNEYNARATMTELTYDLWATRTTEVALAGLASKLTAMEEAGVAPGDALNQIRSMDPEIAKQFIQVLHQGTREGGPFLEDQALREAFDNAMLGSAAIAQGLGLPGVDRIEEIRSAGISRAAALQGYGDYAKNQNMLRSMARRAGYEGVSQDLFEKSSFLSDAGASRQLEKASGMEEALGRATQGSAFSTQGGRFQQMGLRT